MERENVVQRIWQGDHTLWKPDSTEITDRLGWLRVADEMLPAAPDLAQFAENAIRDGFRHALVLGMGGSSLAPEVFAATYGHRPDRLELHVLDSTHPDSIARITSTLDLARTLFVVSSKSGGTIETLSHLAYFWGLRPHGHQFVAVTDPGSALESLGRDHDFRRVFLNQPDIGGRFSALSYFGLVPAALAGVDLPILLERASQMAASCGPGTPIGENPGAVLGAILGEAAILGRDKLTLSFPPPAESLGAWIEQLVAESTGKEGKGILPVDAEPAAHPSTYGADRLFAALGDSPALDALAASGQPVTRQPWSGPKELGAEFFRWEFATAVACHILAINPFDQPDVQAAKDATARFLSGAEPPAPTPPAADVLALVVPGDYIAINAYIDRSPANLARLQSVRGTLLAAHRVATTVGFGPRFLHSTGQLHKGGPASGVFLQIVDEPANDIAIPEKPYTFGTLIRAQADGDLASLQERGRRVARLTLDELEALPG